jgi:hypothetical protein
MMMPSSIWATQMWISAEGGEHECFAPFISINLLMAVVANGAGDNGRVAVLMTGW